MGTKRVAVYVRISRDKTGAGLGVARQEKDCRALATGLGWSVAEVYCDNDLSAYSGKPRPSYLRMLADLEAGKVEAVVTWHTDRLHRSPKELETYVELAERLRIPTQTVKAGELDLATPSGRAVARTLGAWARYESEHKSERIARKNQELAEAGKPMGGGRPFGYEADGISVRTSEALIVREVTQRVIAGDSLASIMRDLNYRGVTSTRGNAWRYSNLRSLIQRPRNAALSVYRGEVVGAAQWPALVTEEEWRAANAVLSNPDRRTTTGNTRKHLLSGMVVCHECGKGMKPGAVTSRGKRYSMYRCHVYRSIPKIDQLVSRVVLLLLVNRSIRTALTANADVDVAKLNDDRDALSARLDDAASAFAEGAITLAQMTTISASLKARLHEIDEELATGASATVFGKLLTVSDLVTEWAGLSIERKRAVIDALMTVTVLPVGRNGRGPQPIHKGLRIELKTNAAGADDLTAAILGERLTTEQQRQIVRAFAA